MMYYQRPYQKVGKNSRSPLPFIPLLTASLFAAGAIDVEFVNSPWIDKSTMNVPRSFLFTNTTDLTLPVNGVRFSIPEGTKVNTGTSDGSTKLNANDPWNGNNRYEVRIGGSIAPNGTRSASAKGGGPNSQLDWTPTNPQLLMKTRSFADMADFVDANPVTIDQIDSIIAVPSFYDENLYVSDTLGQRAPLYGAGFIDTYINQEDSTPVTQIQMNEFADDHYVRLSIGYNVKYRPDLMGENDKVPGKDNKAGPLYSMGLAAVQELMHIDMQFLAPMGIIETQAAFEAYGVMGDGSIGARLGMTHLQKNDFAIGMGPMHMEGTGFGEKAYGSYPTFFPYAASGNPQQWFTTPGTESGSNDLGSCSGNSAQIVNASMIATLYCWRGYEQLFRATDFYAKGIFEDAADRQLAAKLYMWGWQAGFGSSKGQTYSGPLYYDNITEITDITPQASAYVKKVVPALNGILESQKNSELNGGTCRVIDMPISLDYIAEFFYGNDAAPYNSISFAEAGNLGKGGILQHFKMTQDDRKQLWSDIVSAFEKMKGKAPSGYSNEISFRYDWLTILRIAKGYIYPVMFEIPYKPVMLPTPTDGVFKNWVNVHSTEYNIPGVEEKDEIFPTLYLGDAEIADNGDFTLNVRGGDNSSLNLEDSTTVEWSIDPTWQRWHPGSYISGTETDANFAVTITKQVITENFGEQDGQGWIRVTDRSGNSTVDTFTIGGVTYPKIDLVFIIDTLGDGVGRTIKAFLTPGGADDADALDSWSNLRYSWPTQNAFLDGTPSNVSLENNTLTITESSYNTGSGLGLLTVDYPSKQGYRNDILDRVGPAIKTASLDLSEPRDMDTLLLTISEPIAFDETGSTPFLIVKRGNTETAVSATSVVRNSETEIKWIFDKSLQLVDQDSVKFVFENETVLDLVGNPPVSYNQWVRILKNGDKVPGFTDGAIFDRDGDGHGDSLAIVLNAGTDPEPFTTSDITSLQFSWPTDNSFDTYPVNSIVSQGTQSFSFIVDTITSGYGAGAIAISYPEDGIVNGSIADRVGAALHDSVYFDRSDSDRTEDTLLFRTTEQIDLSAFVSGTVYLQFAATTDGTVSDEVSLSMNALNGDTIKTTVAKDHIGNSAYRWVRLAANGLLDLNGNSAHPTSQWVPLSKMGSESSLNSAAIFDTKGDGYGNRVYLDITQGSDPEALDFSTATEISYQWPNSSERASAQLVVENGTYYFEIDTTQFKAGFGEGSVEIRFPDTTISSPLADSTGPALLTAARLFSENSENDTVLVTSTEKIKENFLNDHSFFAIVRGSSVTPTSSKSISLRGDSLVIIFPFGTVEQGDSLMIVEDGGIVDLLDNRPHANNRRVLIDLIGGKAPTALTGEIFDGNGDGVADSIFATITPGTHETPDRAGDLVEGTFTWPATNSTQALTDWTALSVTELSFTTLSSNATVGSGEIELTFPNGTIAGTLNDRVGPVIIKAELWENLGGDDTVQITFSEDITGISGSYQTVINLNGTEMTANLISIYHGGSSWLFSFPQNSVNEGDLVNIINSSNLMDMANNSAHINNIQVPVTMRKRPISVVENSAFFYDNDIDGTVDHLEFTLVKEVVHERMAGFELALVWPNESGVVDTFTITDENLTVSGAVVSADLTSLPLQGELTEILSGCSELTLKQPDSELTNGALHHSTFTAQDRMAPILVGTALYRGKKLTSDEETFMDTLILNYSETVSNLATNNSSSIFDLIDESNGDSEYQIRIANQIFQQGSEVRYAVEVTRNVSVIPELSDSIRIAGDGSIVDNAGNSQIFRTPYIPFSQVILPAEYDIVVYPNPFTIGSNEPNPLVVQFGDNGSSAEGLVAVMVRPFGNRAATDLAGTITLYDVIGNIVLEQTPFEYQQSTGVLLFTANGTNDRNRELGSGQYLAQIAITNGNQTTVYSIMIGMKQ